MSLQPKTIALAIIAIFVVATAFLLAGWLLNFSSLFFEEKLLKIVNPIGIIGIVLILVIGGFYLFKIGFAVLKGAV